MLADATPGPSFALIRPQSIVLERAAGRRPAPGTRGRARSRDIDRLGDRVRVHLDGALPLTAEITAAALTTLALRPGDHIHAAVKATDIESYPV